MKQNSGNRAPEILLWLGFVAAITLVSLVAYLLAQPSYRANATFAAGVGSNEVQVTSEFVDSRCLNLFQMSSRRRVGTMRPGGHSHGHSNPVGPGDRVYTSDLWLSRDGLTGYYRFSVSSNDELYFEKLGSVPVFRRPVADPGGAKSAGAAPSHDQTPPN